MPTWTTALVTGASSGIGEAIARELAREGSDLVLVARSKDVLESLAAELRDAHAVEVEVLAADLADDAGIAQVSERLGDDRTPVELLVNNAGFGRSGKFVDLDADDTDKMLRLNISAVTALSRAAIPTMQSRGRGTIINVASLAGMSPTPGMAPYGASKAYDLSFSEALHAELADLGIVVSALCPGFTTTGFQDEADFDSGTIPKQLWQDSATVARAALDGARAGKAVVVPGFNQAVSTLSRLAPSAVLRKGTRLAMARKLPSVPVLPGKAPRHRALITGASRGLGAEFARQLAAGGTHLVLVARTKDDLVGLSEELGSKHGIDVEVLVADLATADGIAATAARLEQTTEPVDLFVNNAGIGSTGPIAKASVDKHLRLIDVNVRAATRLAHAATVAMLERGQGSVINVSSLASFQPTPNASVYGAGKMYFRLLSEAVHEELQGTGVRWLALCPGYTRTDIFEASGGSADDIPPMLLAEVGPVVATALRRLDQPGATTVPVWYNRAVASMTPHLPRKFVRNLAKRLAG